MAIKFAAASTAGLNNPGTEIITLVKDEIGNFINPPSYDKMRAYLSSGEVPMLFITAEGGETGSLYQFVEYSETENIIRFSNSVNAIEFCAGCETPVVSDVGGGTDDVYTIKLIVNAQTGKKELQGDYAGALAAWQSEKSLQFVEVISVGGQEIIHYKSFTSAKLSSSFVFSCYSGNNFISYTLTESGITFSGNDTHLDSLYLDNPHGLFLHSSTENSIKRFLIRVNDAGELSVTEVTA